MRLHVSTFSRGTRVRVPQTCVRDAVDESELTQMAALSAPSGLPASHPLRVMANKRRNTNMFEDFMLGGVAAAISQASCCISLASMSALHQLMILYHFTCCLPDCNSANRARQASPPKPG